MPEILIESLLEQAMRDAAMQRIHQHVTKNVNQPINVVGPSDTQKAWLSLALSQKTGRLPCFLVADELRARSLATDLKAINDQPVLIFRPRELNLADADAVSHEDELRRLAILTRLVASDIEGVEKCGAIIIPAAAAIQKIMPRATFIGKNVLLKVGQKLDIEDLCQKLLTIGYERMRLVDGPGQFARRGDIIDVVPASPEDDQPETGLRLSFFDIEIDSIKQFDLETQRSTQMLSSAALPPAREILIDREDTNRLAEQVLSAAQSARSELSMDAAGREASDTIRTLCRHDAERITSHIAFAGLDRWLPLIYPEAESVLDYCFAGGHEIFVDEPLRFRNRLDAAQADLSERIRTMLTKGHLAPLSAEVAFRGVDISIRIDQHGRCIALCQIASSGNGLPGAVQIDIAGRPADSWRGREMQLVKELKSWQQTGQFAVLFSGSESRQARLRDLLKENGLNFPVLDRALPRGFIWPAAGLMTIGTQDIFGSERSEERRVG